jgi:hypothetical protein
MLVGRERVGDQRTQAQHGPVDAGGQAGDLDLAVLDLHLVADPLLQLGAVGGRRGGWHECDNPDVAVAQRGVGGLDQHRMAGGEQHRAVLPGDVGLAGHHELVGQVELAGDVRRQHHQRAVAGALGEPTARVDVAHPEPQTGIHPQSSPTSWSNVCRVRR